jgi:hypothetical protein
VARRGLQAEGTTIPSARSGRLNDELVERRRGDGGGERRAELAGRLVQ